MVRLTTSILATSLMLFAPGDAQAGAYTGGAVTNGGAITGKVTYAGAKRSHKKLPVTKDHKVCGHTKPSQALVLGSARGVANAVVYIAAISSGKPAKKSTAILDQRGCTYVPHVQATVRGSKIQFRSSDAILHNVHGTLAGKRLLFNVAMPLKGQRITKKLKKPGVVEVTCDAGHTWMKAYVHVFRHPYFAVTTSSGSFRLDDVPPGKYELVVWHETLGIKKTTVAVTAGDVATSSFRLR